jgi:predicted dehydrogenase
MRHNWIKSSLQVAQLLRHFIQSVHTGTAFPRFGDAAGLHRTLEAVVHSSATGRWEVVAETYPSTGRRDLGALAGFLALIE